MEVSQTQTGAPNWAKNSVFVAVLIVGVALLFQFLMPTEGIVTPQTFGSSESQYADIESVAAFVDSAFEKHQRNENVLESAPLTDDLTVARRLGLGLAGTLPSLQEVRELEAQPTQLRIHWWVSRLLEDERTGGHVAERIARALVSVDEGPFVLFRRRRFVDWLSQQFQQNVPYDAIAKQILLGEGLWTDSPEVNFYTKTMAEEKVDPMVLAGKTSRAFLGMRIDCLQCHDDFIGTINLGSPEEPTGGSQLDFHQLAAYFGKVQASIFGIREVDTAKAYQHQLLEDEAPREIEPAVPFHRELVDPSLYPRQQLAAWLTHPQNRPFARAAVNRFWAIMSGRPLIEPVDDIPLEGPFPPAMEVLVDDFIENNYNVHRLIRIIACTKAFRRDSCAEFDITHQHENAWAVFPMSRLRPDQVSGAIIQSTSLTPIDATSHIVSRLLKFGQQNDFVKRFGDAGEAEFEERGETVTQRLLMLNGQMVKERIQAGLSPSIRMRSLSPDVETALDAVYLCTLARRPSGEEATYFRQQLDGLSISEQDEKLRDLYWTLINSLEFSWNR